MTIFMDGYLQDTGTDDYLHGSCNHQHGELPAWMTTFMAPVTISIDGYLQNIDTADYQHSKLLAWMAISTDGYRHGGLSSWMAIFMVPVTISIDSYLHGSCNC